MSRNNRHALIQLSLAIAVLCPQILVYGKPPPDLPGEDITEKYADLTIPGDSLQTKAPPRPDTSQTWLSKAARTWEAPPLRTQIAADHKAVPLGKGAVFVPRYAKGNLEPEIELLDRFGQILATGRSGKKFNVLPGTYYAVFGSGSHEQRMVRPVEVSNGKVTPIIPDWSGLIIDIVDENNNIFRGQYEIARIDKFDAYGRGYGRDPDLGEELKVWILPPGTYKIFGVGESYNTLRNFITVRLVPGELTRVLLVETQPDMQIVSGGTVNVMPGRKITSNWNYGIDIGGSIEFISDNDREDDTVEVNTKMGLLINNNFTYKKNPFEWSTTFRMDQQLDIQGLKNSRIENTKDEFRVRSRVLWRFLPWLGPYGRTELETGFFPTSIRFDEEEQAIDHYFAELGPDTSVIALDSTNDRWMLEPSFSPLRLEAGLGANADLLTFRFIKTRLLAGFGLSQLFLWNRYSSDFDTTEVKDPDSLIAGVDSRSIKFVQPIEDVSNIEFGPEVLTSVYLTIGRWANVESELRVLIPLDHIEKPSVLFNTLVSWRLIRSLALVYEYEYERRQPEQVEARIDESSHRIQLRVSFTSR
ncbi:MAG: hypothetical protein GF398_14455 [Chitinivibrionales bacterium]|nr:hypothetical protein [Chitinivibrionales bacterium]